ncbi:MAG: LTA synthase family protein [Bacillota bacterium]|nr:LTA synthase family protein [Bacillota bacterium]
MTTIMQFLRSKYDSVLFSLFAFFAVYEATNPAGLGGAAVLSVLYAFLFIYLGYRKVRLKGWESFAVLLGNIIFIKLFSGSGIFTINLFLLSFILYSCVTPMLSRFKYYFPAAVILLVAVSFLVPFHLIKMPLFIFLYYPIYILGFELESVRIKKGTFSTAVSIIGIVVFIAVIVMIFALELEKGSTRELRFIYDLYNNKSIFVYSPIIVVSFLMMIFSCINLLLNAELMKPKKTANINLRAVCVTLTIFTPVLYSLNRIVFAPGLSEAAALLAAGFGVLVYTLVKNHLKTSEIETIRTFRRFTISLSECIIDSLLIFAFVFLQVAAVEFVIRGGSISAMAECVKSVSFAYNLLFVLLLFGCITALLGVRLGSVMMILLNLFLVLANFIKVKFFNEPFYLWDTFLVKDALIISKEYVNTKTVLLLSLVLLVVSVLFIKNIRKVLLFLKPRPHLVLLVIAIYAMRYNLYQLNIFGYARINVCDSWDDSIQEFLDNGVYVENTLYLENIDKYFNVKPADYSREKIESIVNSTAPVVASTNAKLSTSKPDTQPNVVVILQESFWDASKLPNVTFNKQIDSNLQKYQNATFVSPVFGGGTANVEFEVLTGFSNFFFNKGIISYDVYVDHNIMALPQVFKNNGYTTTAIHPNTGEMYKRSQVYNYMGFDKFVDINGFNYAADKKGNFVSDDKFADKIIETLNATSDDKPKFIMGVSIQNHDSYDSATKGYSNTDIKAASDKLNAREMDILNNYTQGIYDGDKEIGKIIEAAGKSSRPTLVYIFGDHLPRLGYPLDNLDIYYKTGYLAPGTSVESSIKMYETPVVRWASFKELPKLDPPMSPSMLALEILQDSGVNYPGYFNYLKTVEAKYPYLSNNLQYKNQLMQDDILKNYYLIQYDLMFGKSYAK